MRPEGRGVWPPCGNYRRGGRGRGAGAGGAAGCHAQRRVRGAGGLNVSGGGAAILNGSPPRRRERGVAAGRCPPSAAAAAPRGCGERAGAVRRCVPAGGGTGRAGFPGNGPT